MVPPPMPYAQPHYPAYPHQPVYAAPPTQPIMAPPPPLPSMRSQTMPDVQLARDSLPPQPGQDEFFRRPDNWPGRGYLVRYVGEAIHREQNTPLNVRCSAATVPALLSTLQCSTL